MMRSAIFSFALTLCLSFPAWAQPAASQPAQGKKKIAVIATQYTNTSHANALATKFFTGYPTDDGMIEPKLQVVSMYVDQTSDQDLAHELARRHGITIYPTITGALTLGGKSLAVDGMIYIGVHGNYPVSHLGARMYPHMRHLEEVFAVFDSAGRSVPVYCDKELGYSWLDTKWIYDRARELNVTMMAGSVLPVVWRDPQVGHTKGAKIAEAVAVGYGPLNSYVLHTAEIMQSMLENRAGGETGIASVQCLRGAAMYEAGRQGRFSMDLAEAACATIAGKKKGTMEENDSRAFAELITYRDGTKATLISCSGYIGENFAYAGREADGKIIACEFVMPHDTIFAHFSYQWLNVERMMVDGKPGWPLERNLLSQGVIDAGLRSQADQGRLIETPYLSISYPAPDPAPIRPRLPRPTGASLGPWPPQGFDYINWDHKAPAAKR